MSADRCGSERENRQENDKNRAKDVVSADLGNPVQHENTEDSVF